MYVLFLIIVLLVGVLCGMWITSYIGMQDKPKPAGILQIYIDEGSDEQPYLFLDLDESVDSICGCKRVIFDVNINHVNARD